MKDKAQAELERLEGGLDDTSIILNDPEAVLSHSAELKSFLKDEAPVRARAWLKTFLKGFWVEPGHVTYEYNLPLPPGSAKTGKRKHQIPLADDFRSTTRVPPQARGSTARNPPLENRPNASPRIRRNSPRWPEPDGAKRPQAPYARGFTQGPAPARSKAPQAPGFPRKPSATEAAVTGAGRPALRANLNLLGKLAMRYEAGTKPVNGPDDLPSVNSPRGRALPARTRDVRPGRGTEGQGTEAQESAQARKRNMQEQRNGKD